MATKIEWTQETWNPIIGCSKVSPGCDNCYAEKMAARINHIELAQHGAYSANRKYKHVVEGAFRGAGWNGKTHLIENTLEKPLHWKKPRIIFVCSMGDLFHESVPFEWILEVWFIMKKCPQHTFQILTKRPERMHEFLCEWAPNPFMEPLPNVWLGVTAENQQQADKRIPILFEIPAAKRFVSCEPLLSRISFEIAESDILKYDYLKGEAWSLGEHYTSGLKLDWVIAGGESGRYARPMHPLWVIDIKIQCEATNVPFFFKQWGEWVKVGECGNDKDSKYYDHPKCTRLNLSGNMGYHGQAAYYMMKVGKKYAGSLLDGKEYKQMPK